MTPASAREVFATLPHLLTDPYIPEIHGDLDDEPEPLSPERLAEIAARWEHIPSAEVPRISVTNSSRGGLLLAALSHAPADVPALLARVAELEAEADRLAHDRAHWRARYYEESRTYWDAELPPGGECCADCGQPVESESCAEHHPATVVARLRAQVADLKQQRDAARAVVAEQQEQLSAARPPVRHTPTQDGEVVALPAGLRNLLAAVREVLDVPTAARVEDRAAADRLRDIRVAVVRETLRWVADEDGLTTWSSDAEALRDAAVAAYPVTYEPHPGTSADPVSLRWGLDDVLWGDDDSVVVLLSDEDLRPYVLELEPEQAAALRNALAGPHGDTTRADVLREVEARLLLHAERLESAVWTAAARVVANMADEAGGAR